MIALSRNRAVPPIDDHFVDNKRTEWEKELLTNQRKIKQGALEKHKFSSSRWKLAKEQLIEETHGKCAYCEAPTTMVAYGDVEHYRPKSVYWWLAYNYDNYLVSCQICNQKFKSDKFPYSGSKLRAPRINANTTTSYINTRAGTFTPDPLNLDGPNGLSVQAFEALHDTERPELLNPYFDDPTKYYAWQADDTIREVELRPLNQAAEPFVEAAEDDYGLNRQELKNLRYLTYNYYQFVKQVLDDPGISPALRTSSEAMIQRMQADDAPFAGMIRYFESL